MCKLNNKKGEVAKKGTKVKMKGSQQNIYLRLISKFKRAKKALGYLKRNRSFSNSGKQLIVTTLKEDRSINQNNSVNKKACKNNSSKSQRSI